ncbi:ABC transporter substrate-binding protein [Castellaniella defragrans]|jgi:NitT/TauT family transport system substrate-binding protein|uniref:NitT/TauT family transport system substrate-binding protein n=1 Tax=Castellaniella defragrans TaxID=75697 RepID=A0A7W9TR89_CASDE|nr:ABC transporter substrate-binding protein [Castellaniella defragrans]MBB6085418.1 NitT/TauT family transport system substrate-binding protein [Castellaniella defragrans]
MERNWRRALYAGAGVFAWAFAMISPSVSVAKDLAHITVSVAQATDINGMPWKVAQTRGFFEREGIVLDKVLPAEGGGATLHNVIAGNLPFGQVATSSLVNAHMKGAPIKIIAGATQVPFEIGWGVLKDSPIKSVKDLEGKTWGFTNAGSVTEAMSFLVPKYAGLDMKTTKRVATGGVGAGIALLQSGDVDITFFPPLTEKEHAKDLRVVVRANEFVPYYELTMIVSSRNYAEKNPEVARGLLRALQSAIDWIKANPAEAGEMYAASVNVDPEIGKELIQKFIDLDVLSLAFNPKSLAVVEEGLRYTDNIERVNWKDLLTDAYLPEGHKGRMPD